MKKITWYNLRRGRELRLAGNDHPARPRFSIPPPHIELQLPFKTRRLRLFVYFRCLLFVWKKTAGLQVHPHPLILERK